MVVPDLPTIVQDLPTILPDLPTVVLDLPTYYHENDNAGSFGWGAKAPLPQAPLAIFMFFKFFAEAPLAKALMARLIWLGSFGSGSFDSHWYLSLIYKWNLE